MESGRRNIPALNDPARDYKPLLYSKFIETHLFCRIGRIIASELQPAELIHKIVTAIRAAIPFDDASVYLVTRDLTELVPILLLDPSLQNKMSVAVYFDNGAPGRIAASGDPLHFDDVSTSEGFLHHPDEPFRRGSYIGVPLKSENRIIGVMGFGRREPWSFRVEDFDLLRTLAPTISAGLEKAELFRRTLEISRTDELTGMLNYRVMLEKLEEEIGRQVRTGRPLSFIMVDIDDFKRVNDRFGHLEGSRLIAQMGPLLRDACRSGSTDTCFRYGGEEFSLLLAESGREDALVVAERVRASVETYPFTLKAVHPSMVVTVSLGVSTMEKGDGKTPSDLIREADLALYRSKTTGKNRVTSFTGGLEMPGEARDSGQWRP